MNGIGATEITPRPVRGRIFDRGRRIRLADVDANGRCRLDAIARHLQDVARDDSADSKLPKPMDWIVRRTLIEVRVAPVYHEWIKLSTWCSGYGSRWAERRTEVRGQQGADVETVTIWVHIDTETWRPARLTEDFFKIWGESTDGRRVNARNTLPTTWPDSASSQRWPIRVTDIDLLGHVNNAAQWTAVEQALYLSRWNHVPIRAELEHGPGVQLNDEVRLRWLDLQGGLDIWLSKGEVACNAARIRPIKSEHQPQKTEHQPRMPGSG